MSLKSFSDASAPQEKIFAVLWCVHFFFHLSKWYMLLHLLLLQKKFFEICFLHMEINSERQNNTRK